LIYSYCKKNFEQVSMISKRNQYILDELKLMYNYENSLEAGVAGRRSSPKGDLEVARAIIVDKTDV
tara:strand:+ start:465 stop:662 length:198 start_codon:yes stop_codon:yes gene_type:complete